jgi:hypothetical protein
MWRTAPMVYEVIRNFSTPLQRIKRWADEMEHWRSNEHAISPCPLGNARPVGAAGNGRESLSEKSGNVRRAKGLGPNYPFVSMLPNRDGDCRCNFQ